MATPEHVSTAGAPRWVVQWVRWTAGGCQVASSASYFGQYIRSIKLKLPAGAGSQLLSEGGGSCWISRSRDPSGLGWSASVADRVAVYRVVHKELTVVVHRQRPERVHRRPLPRLEVHPVRVLSGERLTIGVDPDVRVDRVLLGVRAQPDEGDERAEPVVGSIATEAGQLGPAVYQRLWSRIRKRPGEPSRTCSGACATASRSSGSRSSSVNGSPGRRPIAANRASAPASAPAGGVSTMSAARRW